MNQTLMTASSWILLVFLFLSAFDGIYYHLWKFRLQERKDSKFEHITHTLRAVLFVPTIILVYWIGLQSYILWVTLAILAFDLVTEVLDVLNENESRATLGGLPSNEYLVHITLTTLRVAALTLAFAALPNEAWHLNAAISVEVPELSKLIAMQVLPGAVIVASLHVYLIFDPMLITRAEAYLKNKCCVLKHS
ncbi:hypothetical protein DOM22_05490 [Bdellovibrio sp. ZAP7]|uniref:hypothetical protein n=1 Tax=Bdellovibrio sp. ZAP7 TaxID=2231053 RepID=UPI001158B449|nr:hypothetical protein [Bdellovibrio sp. ZAP7]QDK44651.1 hypothetical protein DOM22_05490 [Bdellovibrio sp. ZAP7]